MKKFLVLLALICLLGSAGAIYHFHNAKQKQLTQVDEILAKSNVNPRDISQEKREELAKELARETALKSRLYATMPLVKKPVQSLGIKEEARNAFETLMQEQIEKTSAKHTSCLTGTIENCQEEYFSYQKNSLPNSLQQEYENNTETTAQFCLRNFTKENCEQGCIISHRVGDYKKATFCDTYVDGRCQGNYVLKEEAPACNCGPSVSTLEIRQNNGKWQYDFEDYTPHKILQQTVCDEYDVEKNICLKGKYIQEETEIIEEETFAQVVYQIENGQLLTGPKPLEELKPLLQLPSDIIVK